MPVGQFDSNSPYIEVELSGPFTQPVPVRGLMDTGFSGFIMIPLLQALPMGLVLQGTSSVTLADGHTQVKLTCLGKATFDGQEQIGTVILEPSAAEILIGIDFLRIFSLRLIVDPLTDHIELVPSVLPTSGSLPATPTDPATAVPPIVGGTVESA